MGELIAAVVAVLLLEIAFIGAVVYWLWHRLK